MTHSLLTQIYTQILTGVIFILSRPFEWMGYVLTYGYARIEWRGRGYLNKYVIKQTGVKYLIKKTNWLIEHRQRILRSKESLKRNSPYINQVIKKQLFGDANLCVQANSKTVTYRYIEPTTEITVQNFPSKEIEQIILGMKKLHKKGMRNRDFRFQNILYDGVNCYLIDIDRIEPCANTEEAQQDFVLFLRSIQNSHIKKQITKILEQNKIL